MVEILLLFQVPNHIIQFRQCGSLRCLFSLVSRYCDSYRCPLTWFRYWFVPARVRIQIIQLVRIQMLGSIRVQVLGLDQLSVCVCFQYCGSFKCLVTLGFGYSGLCRCLVALRVQILLLDTMSNHMFVVIYCDSFRCTVALCLRFCGSIRCTDITYLVQIMWVVQVPGNMHQGPDTASRSGAKPKHFH